MMDTMDTIRSLIGDVSREQLRFVDCFVGDKVGLFIPAVGPCLYAITPDHRHPAYSFVLTFDAGCRLAAGGRLIVGEPGRVLAIDPEAEHHEIIEEEHGRYIAIFIERAFFERQMAHYPGDQSTPFDFRTFTPGAELIGLLKDFMNESEMRLPAAAEVLDALGVRIAHSLIRALNDIRRGTGEAGVRVEIHRVIEHMHVHYCKKLSIDALARVAALSPSHFSRVFARETGLSPMNYLIRLRLQKAKQLLRSGSCRVTQVALQCGFNSPSHLTNCFRQAFDITPSEYLKIQE